MGVGVVVVDVEVVGGVMGAAHGGGESALNGHSKSTRFQTQLGPNWRTPIV